MQNTLPNTSNTINEFDIEKFDQEINFCLQVCIQNNLLAHICAIGKKNELAANNIQLSFFDDNNRANSIVKLTQIDGLYGLSDTQTNKDITGEEYYFTIDRYNAMQSLCNLILDHYEDILTNHQKIKNIRSVLV